MTIWSGKKYKVFLLNCLIRLTQWLLTLSLEFLFKVEVGTDTVVVAATLTRMTKLWMKVTVTRMVQTILIAQKICPNDNLVCKASHKSIRQDKVNNLMRMRRTNNLQAISLVNISTFN